MKICILTVIPLQKSLPKDALSYFTSKKVMVGDIVQIPIRNQHKDAIVIHINPIEKEKTIIKESRFKLRPIKKIIGPSPFDPDIFTVGSIVNEYYIGNAIQFFYNTIPQSIPLSHKTSTHKADNEETKVHKKYIMQNSENERFSYYKSFIREKFAQNKSIRICVPTIRQGSVLFEYLKKGIEPYCLFLHSKLTKKQMEEALKKIQNKHSVCFIHTPQFLSVARNDCDTVIVEFESSESYQSQRKPYIDYRVFAETLALHKKQNFILADTFVRTETFNRYENKELETLQKINFTISNNNQHVLLDMKTQENKIFHSQVIESIQKQYSKGSPSLLFSLRASLATSTVCNDCGAVVMYKGSPVTLHENPETGVRFFKSKKFNKTFTSNNFCSRCTSANYRNSV
jgi:primosomal protein N'